MTEQEEFEFRLRFEREQSRQQPSDTASMLGPKQREQLAKDKAKSETSIGNMARDTGLGFVRGVGDIGNTVLTAGAKAADFIASPINRMLGQDTDALTRANEDRLRHSDAAFSSNADTDSISFKGGRIGGNIAATYPVGGALGQGAKAVGLERFGNALASSGMTTGAPVANALSARAADMGIRMAGGAVTGGASAGLVSPEDAGTGAAVGAALPPAIRTAGALGHAVGGKLSQAKDAVANRIMQSALKPTIAQLKSGEADTAVKTLLDYGISPTRGGVDKLRELIDAKNADIAGAISSSGAQIPQSRVLNALSGVRQKFGNQVSPTGDLSAIQGIADDFTANTPSMIPVQAAQDMKQGTYRVLRGKYGQMGSAETEAQKALARGLKEEIATAVPGVGALNAEESRLLSTLGVAERRALMQMNNNPMGLAALAGSPANWLAFMADRSTAFKALAARMVNRSGAPLNALSVPSGVEQLGYRSAPVLAADQ